jgi:eukaryotic-like serine/threonine-protein kinase
VIEREIFMQAMEVGDAAERAEFLARACGGNASLQRRIERLLAEQERLGSYLESPAAALPLTPLEWPASPQSGARIGRYRLLEQIGEGGMGTVWVAEQVEPVRRRVALKLIKLGMDSRQVLARFEVERQALALMDHPHIARFLDAGMVGQGVRAGDQGTEDQPAAPLGLAAARPYFVMELVRGTPITEYCDQAGLTIPQRLELFVQVCQAVQHAHQKGVLHRDLKPSNILVCLYDGVAVPKVIDFGLAKAIHQPLTEHTLCTALGLMVGTPLYMSPEQAEFNNIDVDTRSDIYSLGVILYELLTGTTPLTKEQFKAAALPEILRLIREVEPPQPSTRMSSSAAAKHIAPQNMAAQDIAARRGAEPGQLVRLAQGDLDWIVMKSLEKERSRRYETASALGRDVERYLRHEPVEAGPPSRTYRLRKLAIKHRVLLTTAATVVALLVGGFALSTWEAVRAFRAEAEARASEKKAQEAADSERAARREAQAAAGAQAAAMELAIRRAAETTAVLDFLQHYVFTSPQPHSPQGHEYSFHDAMEAAIPAVDQHFREQPLVEARLRMVLGGYFRAVGDLRTAAKQTELACTLYTAQLGADHRDTLSAMHELADDCFYLGRRAEALQLREKTLARRRALLGANDPETLWTMHELANSYSSVGQHERALALDEEALDHRRETLGPDHRDTLSSMNNVAHRYAALGRLDAALKLHQEALARRRSTLGPTHSDVLMSMKNVARSYLAVGRREEALQLAEEALALYRANFGHDSHRTFSAMRQVAACYAALGRHSEALCLWDDALALHEDRLPREHPETLSVLKGMAESLFDLGRHDEAIARIDDCLHRARGQLIDPSFIASVADLRLRYFQGIQDAAGCRSTAELWQDLHQSDAAGLYRAAEMRAVTAALLAASSANPREAQAEADMAMACLHQAVAAGFGNAGQLGDDADLDVLRGREDFAKLLAALTTNWRRPSSSTPTQ